MPPASRATPPPEPTYSLQAQLWSLAKVVGPAFVAVVALIISLLSYTDQHETDQVAQQAQSLADARLVSAWFTVDSNAVMIQNRSPDPIYNVAIWLGRTPTSIKLASLYLGEFPPCTVTSVTIQDIYDLLGKYIGPTSVGNVYGIAFTDSNNANWLRTMTGDVLKKDTFTPLGNSISQTYVPFTPAASCT